jgi:RNA polymerase sigma factor (sigma-70 family)
MESNLTDEELIKSILIGSEEATSILINRYQDLAYNLCYKVLKNRQNAEEAVQDSFVKAIKAIRAFKGGSSFKTWLYRIIYNTALNRGRKGIFHRDVPIDSIDESQFANASDVSGEVYDQKFKAQQIKAAFDKLNPENRIIVSLYYLESFSIDEISEITLLSTNVIKVRLHRSREQLKAVLKNILSEGK